MKRLLRRLVFNGVVFLLPYAVGAQSYVLDRLVAVVGDEIILQSDIEGQYLQMRAQGMIPGPDAKCQIFESLLEQKLLVAQAKADSIEVTDNSVQIELDQRMSYFVSIVGSEAALEEYFGKSILEIKDDFRELIREKQLTEKMKDKITGSVKITPSEVKEFYRSLPKDSLPVIPVQYEVQQIVVNPEIPEELILDVKDRLLSLRKRILNGESFATLAVLYSEDKESAMRGGEIGFMAKSDLDPEYAKAAFSLKENGVSSIVESEFGFHIIQLIERKGDRVNTRHILMKPKVPANAIEKAKGRLDTLARYIRNDSISFEQAVFRYTMDVNTALNGGLVFNKQTGSSLLTLEEFTPEERVWLEKLKPGEISDPIVTKNDKQKTVLKIIRLKRKVEEHKANLDMDYVMLQNAALSQKKNKILEDWIREKQKNTFIQLFGPLKQCQFHYSGWIKSGV